MAARERWQDIAAVIRVIQEIDRKWMGAVPQDAAERARNTPWMPFQLFSFISMLAEAMPEINGRRYLEVGAGPGTRLLAAQEIFGLHGTGFDVTDEYASAARSMGLDVRTADALAWADWAGYDLVWFNRAMRGEPQAELERRVWEQVSPGAVVMCANLESRPPMPWYPVLDSWDEDRRGIWQKPFAPARS